MASGKQYDELDAVVRIPKGERLADSRETEGWLRGFTPKSNDKGPQHVELRLKGKGEAPSKREPEIIYVTEYVETFRRSELTPAQQEIADTLSEALLGLIKVAKPYVAQ